MPGTRFQGKSLSSGRGSGGPGPGPEVRRTPLTQVSGPASSSGSGSTPAVISGIASKPSQSVPSIRLAPYISVDHLQLIDQDRSRNVPLGSDSYYAIQLNPVSVRIRNPEGGLGRVECTCPGFQSTRSPCAHINWLFTGLQTLLGGQPLPTTPLPQDEIISRLSRLYPSIMGREMDLPSQLNGLCDLHVEPPGTPDLELSEASNPFARSHALCDILSTFDQHLLPEEFYRDFIERAQAVATLENCLEPRNLYLTTYRMAIVDNAVFEAFRKTVSHDYCVEQYIVKQNHRLNAEIARLDQADQTRTGVPATTVIGCAQSLRTIVHQLCQDRAQRPPLAASQARRLSNILVELIQKVCNRNRDLRVGNRPRARSCNHNLYTYLIGNPPIEPSAPAYMKDAFVIDKLRDFPSDDWKHRFEDLTNIRDQIHATENERASLEYAAKLNDMLLDYTRHANEPSSSPIPKHMPGP
ncbi:MAG: hypothetical protein Q9163_001897 [Psora crenata]